MSHRVQRKRIVRSRSHDDGRKVFEAGDVFEPTQAEIESFGDRLEPVEEEVDDFDVGQWLDIDFKERADKVASGEVDSHLEDIREIETSESVREAVRDRMTEFGTAYSEDDEEESEDEESEEDE